MEHLEPIYARIDREFDRHLDRVRRFVHQPSISGEGVDSPNEYATVKGIRLFEKSMARFVYEFAALHG